MTNQQQTEKPHHKTFDGMVRDLATTLVDAKHGYTMEFSSHPPEHAAEYDRMESELRQSLETIGATLAYVEPTHD